MRYRHKKRAQNNLAIKFSDTPEVNLLIAIIKQSWVDELLPTYGISRKSSGIRSRNDKISAHDFFYHGDYFGEICNVINLNQEQFIYYLEKVKIILNNNKKLRQPQKVLEIFRLVIKKMIRTQNDEDNYNFHLCKNH
ncbi:MAG: hypothetical protein LBE20_03600 [Deltaproteobacteria bacterium]|jgi:hypothetical protein|nr:hypothetical protein [Deltaproteobacteria bacterium]